MENLAYLVPVVGCVAMMGVMMWVMRRTHANQQESPDEARRREMQALRDEIAALRDEAAGQRPADG